MEEDQADDAAEPEIVNKATMDAPQEEFIDERGVCATSPCDADKDHGSEVKVKWVPDPAHSS